MLCFIYVVANNKRRCMFCYDNTLLNKEFRTLSAGVRKRNRFCEVRNPFINNQFIIPVE